MSLLTTFLALFTFNLQGQPESDLSPTPDNVRKIGCGANDPNVKRACPCLLRTEQADGSPAVSWLSFNVEHKKGCKAGDDAFTCWGTTWAALGLPHTLLVASAPPSEKVVFEENFTDALGKDWSWYREVRDHWKVDKERKELVMRATRGWMEELRNVPLRDAPDIKKGPFAVEVHVNHVPMGDYEFSGLMWHFDDKNFVVIRKGPHGKDGKTVSLLRIKEGKGEWIKSVGYKDPDVDLRLVVTETKAQGWYRASNAEKWQMIGEVEMPGKGAAKVGLRTGNGEGGSARFSKFRILQLDGR